MISSVFSFFIFIPILAFVLLAVNFIFAPHKPYKEKKTPFECGYHSFSQSRNEFSIIFFRVAIVYLIIDLEIINIFPLAVSSNFIGIYGITVAIIFAIIVTLGFIYELGKGALNINIDKVSFNNFK